MDEKEQEKLRTELDALEHKRREVETKLRELDNKDRAVRGNTGQSHESRKRPRREIPNNFDERSAKRGRLFNSAIGDNSRRRNNPNINNNTKINIGNNPNSNSLNPENPNKEKEKRLNSTIVSARPLPPSMIGNHDNGERVTPLVEEANNNPEIKKRNKQMFGVIVGTLQKFQKETTTREARKQIEEKVDKKLTEQQEKFREQQKKQLQEQREKHLAEMAEIRKAQEEKEIEFLKKTWTRHHAYLSHYIKTTATPSIFYLPKKHTAATTALLVHSCQQEISKEFKVERDDFEGKNIKKQASNATTTTSTSDLDDTKMTGDGNESIQRETSSGNDESMIDKEQANVSEDEKKNMSSPERNHGKEDYMDEDNMDDEEKR